MVHFSIFSGHEGRLGPERGVYISIFGGATLTRMPFAVQVTEQRQRSNAAQTSWQNFIFSLFGGATIRWPPLAEEFIALRDAVRAGALTFNDWDRAAAGAGRSCMAGVMSIHIFGSLNTDAVPNEDQELDDLTWQRHAGHIPSPAVEALMLAVGHNGAQRLAAVRQAVSASLSSGA